MQLVSEEALVDNFGLGDEVVFINGKRPQNFCRSLKVFNVLLETVVGGCNVGNACVTSLSDTADYGVRGVTE